MASRLDLQTILESLLGSQNVYFQPPSDLQMTYPCIVYKRDNASTEFAGNKPYRYEKRYQVTFIVRIVTGKQEGSLESSGGQGDAIVNPSQR